MLLLIVLALVAVIAFFHYVQGFFSATLSAILCVISALVAFGFHEPLAKLLGGKFADYSHAVVLVGVFSILYIGLRFLFDMYIPGNLTMPLLVDKVGAALMGLVAGVFAVGIAVIAAQTLPFGPAIGGYARYAVADGGDVPVANTKTGQSAPLVSALSNEKFNTPSSTVFADVPESGLLIPVDDIVLNAAKKMSDGGALGASQTVASVHPNYLGELFFQRIGIQPGAKRVAINTEAAQQVVFRPPLYSPTAPLAVRDSEPNRSTKITVPRAPLISKPDGLLIVARVNIESDAADADGNVRISPAAVRMVINGKNFTPIGTLDQLVSQMPTILLNRADDFLIGPSGLVIDFVFQIPAAEILPDADLRKAPLVIKGDAFFEAKRMGFASLQGVEVKRDTPAGPEKSLFRKYAPRPVAKVISVGGDGAAAPAATDSPFEAVQPPKLDANFLMPISVGPLSSDSQAVAIADVTGTLRARKFATLEIFGGRNVGELSQGDVQIRELAAPDGKKIVQFVATTRAADRWEWATKLAQIELADAAGGLHKVNGAWAKIKTGDAEDRLLAKYNADAPITELSRPENLPTEIGLIFVVPSGAKLTELRIEGKRLASVDLTVP